MSTLAGSETEKNVLAAFLNESADQNRYLYYAKVAKKAGYVALSLVFEETALQERSHAKSFFKYLEDGKLTINTTFHKGQLGDNMENLIQAVERETEQYTTLYPKYAEVAKTEGFPKIATLFSSIARAERYHAARFRSFIDAIERGTVFKDDRKVMWVCSKCGYVHEGSSALETCPACGHPKAYFERTDLLS